MFLNTHVRINYSKDINCMLVSFLDF